MGLLAARYADRLPLREARLILARVYADDKPAEYIEALREAVREYPEDSYAWYLLGESYFHTGGARLIPPWKFIDAFERAAELDTSFSPVYEHLMDAAFLRRPDSARPERDREERHRRRAPGVPRGRVSPRLR